MKVLEEKIIEELKDGNKNTRQTISQLESRVNELERKLGQVSQGPASSDIADEAASGGFLKKCVECGQDIPTASEECEHCGKKQALTSEPTAETVAESVESRLEEPEGAGVTVTALEDPVAPQQEAVEDTDKGSERKKRRFL